MNKLKTLMIILALLALSAAAQAQDTTTTTTTTAATNTINYFFVACADRAVIDLDGNMGAGYDAYVQVFRGANGTGTPLTGLIRVSVSGNYQVSPTLTYDGGQTLATGETASARVLLARETDSSRTLFNQTVNDIQDGCANPRYGAAQVSDAGTLVDPVTGQPTGSTGAEPTGIFAPDGGIFFSGSGVPAPEPLVQIGARASRNPVIGRANKPGYIFAECDAFPGTEPGTLYDTDNLVVFWSWFARTPEQVQQHIEQARYQVWFNSEFTYPQLLERIQLSPIERRSDGNYWVFYTVNLGDRFRDGKYHIGLRLYWDQAISDGYEDFGPGTDNGIIENRCHFTIEPNPFGVDVQPRNPGNPLQYP